MLARRALVYPRGMASYGWVFLAIGLAFVGGGVAYALARRGRTLGASIWCAVLALIEIGLLVAASVAQGWDGLAYMLVALLFAAPAFVGALIGLIVGLVVTRRVNARSAPTSD